jgi:hypothetical protein
MSVLPNAKHSMNAYQILKAKVNTAVGCTSRNKELPGQHRNPVRLQERMSHVIRLPYHAVAALIVSANGRREILAPAATKIRIAARYHPGLINLQSNL